MATLEAHVDGPPLPPLLLSRDERRVLELHDRLQQLQLEIALIAAQNSYVPGTTGPNNEDTSALDPVKAARENLLDSRARYVLRNEATEAVMAANPIMQAVHSGTNASPIESDLLPVLRHRDAASTALARQTTARRAVLDELTETEAQALRVGRENVDLAAELLALAARSNQHNQKNYNNQDGDDVGDGGVDPGLRAEIADLDVQVRASRRKWRVVKAVAAAVVAGSGVDWARDPELRDVVLDDEDDGV